MTTETEAVPLQKNPKFVFACGVAAGCMAMLTLDLIDAGQFTELIKFVAGAYMAGGG